MKKTVKVTFDESDPLYQFISAYGERFGGRAGASVVIRMMLDQAFDSTPAFKSITTTRTEEPTTLQKKSREGEQLSLQAENEEETGNRKHSDLLNAIKNFQQQL